MINIEDKTKCCGCSVCAEICPNNCIIMQEDSEGFLYPYVDIQKCVNCHLCEKKCPIQNYKQHFEEIEETNKREAIHNIVIKETPLPESYICFLNDKDIRDDSTSGGAFSAIAQYVLDKNGKIYGVKLNEKKEVIHSCAASKEGVCEFRGSKYVESSHRGIYREIQRELESGRWVLYTGTPCQTAGLKMFLKKDYKSLITLDVFCHGVGSPKYWKKYIQYMEHKYNSEIQKVKFREKTYGYNSACLAVYFKNGKSSHKGHDDDLYWTAFSKFFIFRPSCYHCVFKTIWHEYSDFSIGDFWNSKQFNSVYKKANGCSLMLVHSQKGKDILKQIENKFTIQSVDIEEALLINGGPMISKLISSSPYNSKRDAFMKDMDNYELDVLVRRYIKLSIGQRIKCFIKPILYKIGLLNIFKQFKL